MRFSPLATDSDVDKDGDSEAALRVIVTDDDPLVRRVIKNTLQRAGITVIAEAGSGREAVELAFFYQPDVVLMDYMMPGMDGVEATQRIHAHEPAIAVIMFTSLDDDELALRRWSPAPPATSPRTSSSRRCRGCCAA